jgi:PKD repeat protein
MKLRLLLLSATAAAMLAAPALASASDFCVGSPPGCSGMSEPDLQTALNAAQANAGADRVLIGPGNYTRLDGFSYSDGNSANTVEIRGVGSPKPTLTMTTSAVFQPAVLRVAQFGSTVSDLAIDLPNSGASSFGLGVGNGNTIDNVTVTGPGAPPNLQTGIAMAASTASNSTINVSTQQGIGIYATPNSAASITDSTIVGLRGIDIAVSSGHTMTLSRDRVSAVQSGLYNYYGDVDVDNTLIDLRGGSGDAITMDTVDATLDTNTIDANELTIRNGDASSVGVRQTNNDPNSVQTINLRDSILWDVGHPFFQATPAAASTYTINSFLNDYDNANNLPLAGSLVPGQARTETSVSSVNPGFIAPVSGVNGLSGDYRLSFDSPLLDADPTPGLLYPGETDIRGLNRIVAGASPFTSARRDMGAYEYQHAAPTAQASASPSPATTGQPVTFNATGSDVDGDALTYAWTFDDGGTATGASPAHSFGTPGTHSAALTVTDATGLTGSATAQVNVVTPPTNALTGQQAAALKKCKKIRNAAKRRKCKKRARRLPL